MPAAGLPRRGTASGHSQEVLHRDADDRAFHERPGRRQWPWRRRWDRTLFLARDFRRGITQDSSLGGQGALSGRSPARCRHPGGLSSRLWLPFPPSYSPSAPASHSRATAREPAPAPAQSLPGSVTGHAPPLPPLPGPGRPELAGMGRGGSRDHPAGSGHRTALYVSAFCRFFFLTPKKKCQLHLMF